MIKYTVEMRITRTYAQGEYCFESKKAVEDFLENLNEYEIESIIAITKYNKKSFRSAWYEFFN